MTRLNAFLSMRELAAELDRTTKMAGWHTHPLELAHEVTALHTDIHRDDNLNADDASMYRAVIVHTLVAGMWGACGRPVVTVGHATAAAMLSTRLNLEAADIIRPPWPAFLVRLPSPLLSLIDAWGGPQPATLLMAACLPKALIRDSGRSAGPDDPDECRWFYKLCTEVPPEHHADMHAAQQRFGPIGAFGIGTTMWGFNMTPRELLRGRDEQHYEGWQLWDQLEVQTSDQRVDSLTRQLVLNVSQYCEAPNSEVVRYSTPVSMRKQRSKPDRLGDYTNIDLRINAGIDLNLVAGVREYIHTGRVPPAYSVWVAPHWKRVAHGQGRALRKLQWIAPYKRGGSAS